MSYLYRSTLYHFDEQLRMMLSNDSMQKSNKGKSLCF